MNCPACPQTDLPSDATSCPNCGVELGPLRRLRQLPARFLNEAFALAANGKSAEAIEKAAAALQVGAPPVAARLLLGKLLWNGGRCAEARESWQGVLQADPENADAKRLLEMPGGDSAGQASAPLISWPFLALSVVFLFVLGVLINYYNSHSFSNDEVAALRQAAPRVLPADDNVSALVSALNRAGGMTAREESGRVKVIFSEGLFRAGSDKLLPSASSQLRALAEVIPQHCQSCRVMVEGVADSSPLPRGSRWRDNATLGFARAQRAADYLKGQSSGVPLEWTVSSSAQPPYPNDTPENRRRNRTVVLHIWPRPGRAP